MSNTVYGVTHRFTSLIAMMFLVVLTVAVPAVSAQETQNANTGEMQGTNKAKSKKSRKKGTKKTASEETGAAGQTTGTTSPTGEATGTTNPAKADNPASTTTGAEGTVSPSAVTDATTVTADEPAAPKPGRRSKRGRASAGASSTVAGLDPAIAGTTADLSGTYDGIVKYPDGGLDGPATLTVTGNQFTLTPEGGTPVSGNISAVTTRGYTGVAMQMGAPQAANATAGAPAPTTVSTRLKKSSRGITLSPASGTDRQFSFTPAKKKK